MKKRLSMLLAGIAMLLTGMASTGCILFLMEDIDSCGIFYD